MNDVLFAQRVNKQLRYTIKNSLPLQQQLFYRPIKTNSEDSLPKVNSHLEKVLNLQGLRTADVAVTRWFKTETRRPSACVKGVGSAEVTAAEKGKPAHIALRVQAWEGGETREAPGGSWEGMRVTDIACVVRVRHPNRDMWEFKDPVLSEVMEKLPAWYF